jgi:AcrR family transcriptional regulator
MTRSTAETDMRNRILETADRLFYRQGIRAIGVDTIAAETGISKRTLYNYFPSKDELIIAYLSRRIRPVPESSLPQPGRSSVTSTGLSARLQVADFVAVPLSMPSPS